MMITKNGVAVIFQNNIITTREGAKPLIVIDEDKNLTEINFDGYTITPNENSTKDEEK